MKKLFASAVVSFSLTGLSFGQAVVEFKSVAGNQSTSNGALDGWTVADQFGSSQYSGFVGDLGLIYADQSTVSGVSGTPLGTFRGDSDGIYNGQLGLHVFCTDSETGFVGSGADTIQNYQPHTLAAAEARYLSEGVSGYTAGGLKRAAYLMKNFLVNTVSGSDLESATMQALIWEVLTDANPNLSPNQGNYFLRNNTSNSTLNSRSNQMISLANQWIAAAQSNNWGGPDYDADGDIVIWMDEDNHSFNQSVISFNYDWSPVTPVPEPSSALMALLGAVFVLRRKR